MKRYDSDFLEKTDVKNIIEHIKLKGLTSLESYDISSITDDTAIEFLKSMREFANDYTDIEKAKNYSRARTDHFKKRYDKFLMCYDVLKQNDLLTEELVELKKNYDRIMLNKVKRLIKEIKSLEADNILDKEAKLESLERIMESIELSLNVVTLDDSHKPMLTISIEEYEKLKAAAGKQKEEDDKNLVDTSQELDINDEIGIEEPVVDEPTPIDISIPTVQEKPKKKSLLETRLESLQMQLIPEEEIQKLKQETEQLFENIGKVDNNPQLVNELFEKYKASKADLELALDNNEKVNKKIAKLEGAKKIMSLPRKEFNKLKTNAKLKAAEIKKKIHKKMDPIVADLKEKANDAKDFVVEKTHDAKESVSDKLEAASDFVSEKKEEITDKIVTGYNNVGNELQNKVDTYGAEVKSQEQMSSEAIKTALAEMGNEASIADIDSVKEKINKEASKDSKKAERKVALFGALQKLHNIPKSLKDKIKSNSKTIDENQMSTGRTM